MLDGHAQVELTRVLIGSGGLNGNTSNTSLSSSAGESVVRTESSQEIVLTQGFQQPSAKRSLIFAIDITNAVCPSSADGGASVTDIAGCAGPYTVNWSTGQEGTQAKNLPPGEYFVTVSSPNCTTTQNFAVEPGDAENCMVRFINAFSPNGDGVNDTWVIINIELEEYRENKVEIYNRWGQKVWSTTNYNNSNSVWNGETDGGEELPSGTYYYIADLAGTTFKGYIELTR